MKNLIIATTLAFALAACGGSPTTEGEKLLAQSTFVANGKADAKAKEYLGKTIRFVPNWTATVKGDPMQTESCPQGDGWAEVEFVSADKSKTYLMQCPTFDTEEFCQDGDGGEVPQIPLYKAMNNVCMHK